MARYTPVTHLPEALCEHNTLSWDISLPNQINPERIEINTPRLRAISRVAGFSSIHLGQYTGDQTAFEAPAIGSWLGNGTAGAAGTAKVTEAERAKASLIRQPSDLPSNYLWPEARVLVNKPEVTSRIADWTGRGHDAHKAWAYELNGALQRGLFSAAKQNLIRPTDIGSLLQGAAPLSTILAPILHDTTIATIGVGMCFYGFDVINDMRSVGKATGSSQWKERRWSLFANSECQPDRFAAAALLTSLKLVRVAK